MAGKGDKPTQGVSSKPTQVTSLTRVYKDDVLSRMDGRCLTVKVLRERYATLLSDLGGGDELPYQFRSLLQRFVCLESWIEGQEERLAQGEKIDLGQWLAGINAYVPLLRMMGLKRQAKSVATLQDMLKRAQAYRHTNGKAPNDE